MKPEKTKAELLEEDKKRRAKIAQDYVKKAFEAYPEWESGDYELPAPIYPAKLNNVDLSRKRMANTGLDNIQLSVLCGTCASDSSLNINTGYANARYQMKHSTRQSTWFVWKNGVILKEFSNRKAVQFTDPDGFQKNTQPFPGEILGKLKLASYTSEKLTKVHEIISNGERPELQRFWLNHMNNYF